MTFLPTRVRLSALALAVALVPVAAKPADAATKRHHRQHHAARTVTKRTVQPQHAAAQSTAPAPVAPTVTSVISIGGYVFYNLTYAQAVAAYQAQVAAAPAGATPPPVTSVSVTTTVGGSA